MIEIKGYEGGIDARAKKRDHEKRGGQKKDRPGKGFYDGDSDWAERRREKMSRGRGRMFSLVMS
jgi:hypothetical protein